MSVWVDSLWIGTKKIFCQTDRNWWRKFLPLNFMYSCSTGPVYMGLPVKLKLFSVILHYQYLSTKLLSSASQHKTMFHKNDIDRIRNNIGCVGGRRSPKHSIDSASRGASFECFRLRSPPIHPMLSWNCRHHYGQKWRIHNNQPNVRPPNRCCYPRGWWYLWVLRRRRLMRGWFGGCRWCFVSMRPWWFIFRPFLGWVCESQADDDAGLCTFCTIPTTCKPDLGAVDTLFFFQYIELY